MSSFCTEVIQDVVKCFLIHSFMNEQMNTPVVIKNMISITCIRFKSIGVPLFKSWKVPFCTWIALISVCTTLDFVNWLQLVNLSEKKIGRNKSCD